MLMFGVATFAEDYSKSSVAEITSAFNSILMQGLYFKAIEHRHFDTCQR